MRMYFFVLFNFFVVLILSGFFFSSFQQPQDENYLKERLEWSKQQQQLDSLVYYQQLLQNKLQKGGGELNLWASGTHFLSTIMNWEGLELKDKKIFLENTPTSLAWSYAFKIDLYLESNQRDSAYFYHNLLESIEENTSALTYSYGAFASDFSLDKEDLKDAVSYLKKAEESAKTVFDSILLYPIQTEIYTLIGYFEEAVESAEKCIYHLKKDQYIDALKLAKVYNQLADIYLKQEAYYQAQIYYGEAINQMADQANYSSYIAKLWYNLAYSCFLEGGKSEKIILYLHNCLNLLENTNDNKNNDVLRIDAHHLMATKFVNIEKLDSALFYLDKAIKLQKKEAHQLGKTALIQGEIFIKENKKNIAENAFFQAALLQEKEYGVKSIQAAKTWLKTGRLFLEQEKYKQAQVALEKGFAALSADNLSNKLPAIELVLPTIKAVELLNSKIAAMLGLYKRSQYNISLKEIQENVTYNLDLLQHIYQQTSSWPHDVDIIVDAYEKGVETCLLSYQRKKDKIYLRQAFQWVENFKRILLQEDMKEAQNNTFGSVSEEMIKRESLLQKRINWYQHIYWSSATQNKPNNQDWYQQQRASFQGELTQLNQVFKEKYPKYEALKNTTFDVEIDSIQKALKPTTAIVQYLEGNDAVYQVVVRKDTLAFRKIVWEEYKKSVLKYYKHFTDAKLIQHATSGAYKDFCITSYELYHKLVHHDLLNTCKKLVVIPDGLLNYVPFETLLTEIPLDSVHKVNFPSLAYLLKQKSISYNHSSSLWLQQLKKNNPIENKKILGMSASYQNEITPEFREQVLKDKRLQLKPFENAKKEIDSLAKKYDGNFYTDRYASEYYLKNYAGSYAVLHLAFSGVFDKLDNNNISLILAEDAYAEEDNFLTINEIKQLNLKSSMVVLSNCQSAYGNYQRGEGLIALGQSFMYAGAASVVLSLWEQQETNSALVLNYFYENLLQKMPKDQALQQAKLRYLKTTEGVEAHPTFWASYIQFGNSEAIEISEPVTHIWWFIIPVLCMGLLGWWSLRALKR